MDERGRLVRFDLSPLGHPIWWLALAVLVVNDALLKGHALLPGWLTGKLSDFAFLIVAPVLAAALLPLGLPRRRALAVGGVAGLFAAAKLSPALSDLLVAILARIGVHWRLWPDPSDLVGLAVLPIAVWLVRTRPAASASRGRAIRERAGVVLGAAACIATSGTMPQFKLRAPFLLNGTTTTATVNITWVLSKFDCYSPESPAGQAGGGATPAMLAATLTAGDLDDTRQFQFDSGQVAALYGPPPAATSAVGVCAPNASAPNSDEGPCAVAILESPPADPVIMVTMAGWGSETASRCAATLNPSQDPGPDAVTLKDVNGTPTFVAGADVRIGPVDRTAIAARAASPVSCRTMLETYRALLAASQPCSADSDCVANIGLPIPGDASICGGDFNTASAATLASLRASWVASCSVSNEGYACTQEQPAVCRGGTCAQACPGITLPACPPYCPAFTSPGLQCEGSGPCMLWDWRVCSCPNGTWVCSTQPPVAGCSISCLPRYGGTLVDGSVVDVGVIPVDGG